MIPNPIRVARKGDAPAVEEPSAKRVATAVAVGPNYVSTSVEDVSIIEGIRYDLFCDSLVMEFKPEAQTAPEDEWDAEIGTTIDIVQGRYWAVGVIEGKTCWRQEKVTDPLASNNKELFLHWTPRHGHEGWWLSEDLRWDSKTQHHAWSSAREGEDEPLFPRNMRIPYWRGANKKGQLAVVQLTPMHDIAIQQVDALQTAALERDLQPDGVAAEEADEGWDQPEYWHPQSQKTGWMNRAAPLVLAVQENRWEDARDLAKHCYHFPTMEYEVGRVKSQLESGTFDATNLFPHLKPGYKPKGKGKGKSKGSFKPSYGKSWSSGSYWKKYG